jgi:hypothetical protein
MFEVYKNAVDSKIFEECVYDLTDSMLHWQYCRGSATPNELSKDVINCGTLYHEAVNISNETQVDSQKSEVLRLLVEGSLLNTNYDIKELYKVRLARHLWTGTPVIHGIHTDWEFPHIVGLLYLEDSDGDTLFYDNIEGDNIIHRQTPVANTLVLFSGSINHSSATPTKHATRTTLNFSFN